MSLSSLIDKLSTKFEIVVGFPKDKQVVYPPDNRKGHHNKGGQTVAQVATWNEFGTKTKKGTPHIPSRPFLRTALQKNRSKILKMIQYAFSPKEINNPARFDKIGLMLVSMVQDSITNGNWVPNADVTKTNKLQHSTRILIGNQTKAAKAKVAAELAKTRPLIDRGIMRKSVAYEVRSSS